MTGLRKAVMVAGLFFYAAVGVLAALLAVALGPAHPLVAFWLVVPAPAVLALLAWRPPGSRLARHSARVYLVVAPLATFALWGLGWMVSGQLREGALARDETPPKYNLEVTALTADTISVRATDEDDVKTVNGIWGLEGPAAYYQVTDGRRLSQETEWRFSRLRGELKVGDRVQLDSWAWPEGWALAGDMQSVNYRSPLGEFPALKLGGRGEVWAIFVHGRGAGPAQGIRLSPVLSELGLPTLFITYRNDEGVPASPDGFYRYGQTEWQDLEGAVRYALDRGAGGVVLVGWSMGGSIVARFLYASRLQSSVRAVVLDSPVLDFEATVDYGARQRGIPPLVVASGKAVSRYRFGVDWAGLDYLSEAEELNVPTLVMHGEADETVPIETSIALFRMAGKGLVRLESFPEAPHVASWNVDPGRYDSALREFLAQVVR